MAPISILIINPNSTKSMTTALIPYLMSVQAPDSTYTFFTAPFPSPKFVENARNAQRSAEVAFPAVLPLLQNHDGFLVACYCNHPLIPMLRSHTDKPVVGIFQASVTRALQIGGRFGIVTTLNDEDDWEEEFTIGVERFLGGTGRFAGVTAANIRPKDLDTKDQRMIYRGIEEATVELLRKGDIEVVCLGGAGMAGMQQAVRRAAEKEHTKVTVVDGLVAGVVQVVGLVRCQRTAEAAKVSKKNRWWYERMRYSRP